MWRTASTLVGVSLILTSLGFVMLASTSSAHAFQLTGDPFYFVKRQAVSLILALAVGFLMTRVDYRLWDRVTWYLVIGTIILLILALVPGIGVRAGGSSRWIRLGPVTFQPSELAKLTVIIMMAWYLSRKQRQIKTVVHGLLIPLILLGLVIGLIFISPDFGTTVLIGAVGMLLMFVSGTRISHLSVTAVLGASAFILAVMQDPVRMRRVMAFRDPEKYALTEAFQLLNAIYAFVVGGAWGVGLGESIQKRFYLPESHTDFIFAIIGEELGIIASLGVMLLFGTFFALGLFIAHQTRDLFGKLLALGITLMISFQAAFNIAVVTGAVPTKGLALPFISYGGSSMVMTYMMVGILISVALYADQDPY